MTDEYVANFLNQYVRIPDNISEKLNTLYPTEYEDIRHCIGLIIVNLLKFDQVAYSRDKNFYSENHTKVFWYKSMLDAVDIATVDGYAVRSSTGRVNYQHSVSSTLVAGPRLGEFYLSEDLELDLESLPLLSVDKRPVYDNADLMFVKERIAKTDRELITHDVYQQLLALKNRLDRIYDESLRLNRNYWNKIVIDPRHIDPRQRCFNRVGLTRIFKNGEVGRWFQKGEMSFQQLPEEERAKLRINGESVTELDYSAMHPHILYAWENKQCPQDFYERIMYQCGCDRFVAKQITIIALNAGSYRSLVGAINRDKGETERANKSRAIPEPVLYNELKKQGLAPKEVVEAIKIAHPTIEKYIYSESANNLMLVESDIMTAVLINLMGLGIVALPVHDSVIVPSRHEDIASQVMRDVYMEYTGFSVIVK